MVGGQWACSIFNEQCSILNIQCSIMSVQSVSTIIIYKIVPSLSDLSISIHH